MKIGLIDVDSHNFPNLPLMKLSAWHKSRGDDVEWWWGFGEYDRVYMSKVFDEAYTPDVPEPLNATQIIKGGTGYFRRNRNGISEVFRDGVWFYNGTDSTRVFGCTIYNEFLPREVEHIRPDYSLYPGRTLDTAYGFLTRGCPRACPFCGVADKEGRHSYKVADLSEWWNGQKNIVLCDPNLLACRDHMDLLKQLADSKAWIDMNQGVDARMLTVENIKSLNNVRIKNIHFAWDLMEQSEAVLHGLKLYAQIGKKTSHGSHGTVYVLTNFNTTMEENLYRIYTLRDMGFDPYVMIYDKPNAPREIRLLQRWCNNKIIFKSTKNFEDYDPKRG
jgi:hypothetical protein